MYEITKGAFWLQVLYLILTITLVFKDDNARPHRARGVQDFLREESVAPLPRWPARCPDLNPTEQIWDIIGHWSQSVKGHHQFKH